MPRNSHYPSAALGAFNATPLEMASAYTAFPGGGTARTPVLVSDLPSLTEWAEDGVTGSVFKRDDAEDLARQLVACLGDREGAAARAEAARLHLDERHRFEDVVARTVGLYHSLTPG